MGILINLFIFAISAEAQLAISNGFYSNGKLVNARQLPDSGEGFLKLFLARNRAFGHDDMIDAITLVGQELKLTYKTSERLQVGDIAQETGGYISGHASHQNGLDADFSYLRKNKVEQSPSSLNGFIEDFVVEGKLSSNFDRMRNWWIFKQFVREKNVSRIFVDKLIKEEMCKLASKLGEADTEAETLRRLRPYPNHSDHFHLRLNCPVNSSNCKEQDAPEEGTGCKPEQLVQFDKAEH